jgi:hypothetical protein
MSEPQPTFERQSFESLEPEPESPVSRSISFDDFGHLEPLRSLELPDPPTPSTWETTSPSDDDWRAIDRSLDELASAKPTSKPAPTESTPTEPDFTLPDFYPAGFSRSAYPDTSYPDTTLQDTGPLDAVPSDPAPPQHDEQPPLRYQQQGPQQQGQQQEHQQQQPGQVLPSQHSPLPTRPPVPVPSPTAPVEPSRPAALAEQNERTEPLRSADTDTQARPLELDEPEPEPKPEPEPQAPAVKQPGRRRRSGQLADLLTEALMAYQTSQDTDNSPLGPDPSPSLPGPTSLPEPLAGSMGLDPAVGDEHGRGGPTSQRGDTRFGESRWLTTRWDPSADLP